MRVCLASVRNNEFDINDGKFLDTPDVNVAVCLGADRHFWLGERDMEKFRPYDVVMLTMSKIMQANYETRWMELVDRLRDRYGDSKLLLMYQEAELEWPIYRPWEHQMQLYRAIRKCDVFMAHNEACRNFYARIKGCDKTTIVANTPMPIEKIATHRKTHEQRMEARKILFGATMDHRAYGLLGLTAVLGALGNDKDKWNLVQFSRIGGEADPRGPDAADLFGVRIESLPYMAWDKWVEALSWMWVGVGLMQAAAAGRDVITMAALGVPYVCNMRLDAAMRCFPDTAVMDVFDIEEAQTRVDCAVTETFNVAVSGLATRNVNLFSREAVTKRIKDQLNGAIGVNL